MKINEFDVVRLKSGEEATVLEIFKPTTRDKLTHYDVEIASREDILTISDIDIEKPEIMSPAQFMERFL